MFKVEVRPAWNVGHGEEGENVWVEAFSPNGIPVSGKSDFTTLEAAEGFQRAIEWVAQSIGQFQLDPPREFRITEV